MVLLYRDAVNQFLILVMCPVPNDTELWQQTPNSNLACDLCRAHVDVFVPEQQIRLCNCVHPCEIVVRRTEPCRSLWNVKDQSRVVPCFDETVNVQSDFMVTSRNQKENENSKVVSQLL